MNGDVLSLASHFFFMSNVSCVLCFMFYVVVLFLLL